MGRAWPGRAGSTAWRVVAVVVTVVSGACGEAEPPDPPAESPAPSLPDLVRVADPGLHPEGIEYDEARERFLISSVTRGTVTAVQDDGSHAVFIEDPDIVSSIGIHIDDRVLKDGRIDVASIKPIARLGYMDYAVVERIFTMFRPDYP